MARRRIHPLPSVEEVRAAFDYDPLTGDITRKRTGAIVGYTMNTGYRCVWFGRYRNLLSHRLAWVIHFGYWPVEIDHRDNCKTNNAISNLREATRSQNMSNRQAWSKSGLKGAYQRDKTKARWIASTKRNGRRVYLGTFKSPEAAAEAFAREHREHYGEFAYSPVGSIRATITFEARS